MNPHFDTEQVQVWHGDCIEVMRQLPDCSVDAVVTDPPYGLEFMGKDWDSFKTYAGGNPNLKPQGPNVGDSSGVTYGYRQKNPRCRNCGKLQRGNGACKCPTPQWDTRTSESAFQFQAWTEDWAAEALRVLKPGGHLLAFGGTRTFHRLTAGIEDAGFEIRDSIAWMYGSGFPKSLDVSKAIDKRPGVERHPEFGAELRAAMTAKGYTNTFDVAEAVIGRRTGAVANWIKYQWPEAKWWPALRDLLDMDGAKWDAAIAEADREATGLHAAGLGTGTAGVGASGVGKERRDKAATDAAKQWQGWGTALKPALEPIVVARKPLTGTVAANVLQYGTGALNIDASRIAARDPEAYAAKGASVVGLDSNRNGDAYGEWNGKRTDSTSQLGRWPANVILDQSQARALDAQSGDRRSAGDYPSTAESSGLFGDRKQGQLYADMGGASRFFYTAKAPTDERPNVDGIAHPTVKPLDLMQWLVRLVTPKGGTVLEPFAGSGTTVEACLREGFRCIAIEREADYLPLIMHRVDKPHAVGLDFGDWEDAS